jgi:hypothetical protein
MNNNTFKAEVFDNQEALNEFILKDEDIIIIKVIPNGEKRALFYEKKQKIYVPNNYDDDYDYSGYGIMADEYGEWNRAMWKKGFPYQGGIPY